MRYLSKKHVSVEAVRERERERERELLFKPRKNNMGYCR